MRNEVIKEECGIQDVVKWTRVRRREWKDYVDRMGLERLAKWSKTEISLNTKRPPKR